MTLFESQVSAKINLFLNLVSSPKKYFQDFPHLDWQMTDENKQLLAQFGSILKQIRTDKGFTLLELEVRTGINEGELSKIENGKRNLAFTTLVKLAKGLEIPVSKLLTRFTY